MQNSTRNERPRHHQSARPYPEFPLTAHPTGRWCKRVRRRVIFFGKTDDPQAALDKWLKEKDELLAGRVPREQLPEGITLRDVANAYLRHKQTLLNTGELSTRTFADNDPEKPFSRTSLTPIIGTACDHLHSPIDPAGGVEQQRIHGWSVRLGVLGVLAKGSVKATWRAALQRAVRANCNDFLDFIGL